MDFKVIKKKKDIELIEKMMMGEKFDYDTYIDLFNSFLGGRGSLCPTCSFPTPEDIKNKAIKYYLLNKENIIIE